MEKNYLVPKPEDFSILINDILNLFKRDKNDSLVITLEGDLGAGKTTFTQELGKELGLSEPITSPTFTIIKQYELSKGDFDQLVHIDAYRIESEDELGPLHIETMLRQPKTIFCIEWPKIIGSIIPNNSVKVSISITESEVRQVQVSQI